MGYLAQLELHRLFLVLWNLIILVHENDLWNRPLVVFLGTTGVAAAIFLKDLKWAVPLSVIPVTAFLVYWYPFNANHLNYYILISSYIFVASCFKKNFSIEDISTLMIRSMGLVYLIAGIHKLNSDFMNPLVSCNTEVLGRFLSRIMLPIDINHAVFPGLTTFSEILLGIGLMLGFRLKFFMLFSLLFHLVLAWSNFVNFASIPLIAFIIYGLLHLDPQGKSQKLTFRKLAALYIFGQLAVTAIGSLGIQWGEFKLSYLLSACIWTLMATMTFYLVLKSKTFPVCRKWSTTQALCLVGVLFLGLQPYLGLGTVNSFSMFSNLKTEGGQWNHLILPDQLRIFDFQDEIYFVEDVTPEFIGTVRDFPKPGLGMPPLEIYRLYNIWQETTPLPPLFKIRKEGESFGRNAVEVFPPEKDPFSWLHRKLLYFRAVQYSGPNECRW